MIIRYSCNLLYPSPTSIAARYVYPLETGDKTAALDAMVIEIDDLTLMLTEGNAAKLASVLAGVIAARQSEGAANA